MAKCPFCKKEVNLKDLKSEIAKDGMLSMPTRMFSCPECDSILGFVSK